MDLVSERQLAQLLATPEGVQIYQRSAVFLLVKAASEVFPDRRIRIEHSLSNGLYGEVRGARPFTMKDAARLEAAMRAYVAADLPFRVYQMDREQARAKFERAGRGDLARLFATYPKETVPIGECGGYEDFVDGELLPTTGLISQFSLRFYLPGFILHTPILQGGSARLPDGAEQPKLASAHLEGSRWLELLDVRDIGALNQIALRHEADELIQIAEALHEKRIGAIAERIASQRDLRLILIAGPSSSGKTTFARRLRTQLRVNGLRPITISLDDYFLDREKTPLDADGKYDYESIEALDLALFNRHLTELIQGETVSVPSFNFTTGKREVQGRKLSVEPDQPMIIEGIHGLNERLTAAVPKRNKFKIYVSALTHPNVSDHIRIPTRDVRLIRRLVRDHKFRGSSAEETLNVWPRVRRGEERNIFPFQGEADVIFDSALVYELGALKAEASALLSALPPHTAQRAQADRLSWWLDLCHPIDARFVPPNSILREFLGGSCYSD
ncbi:MAG TPA: nucleoside kinase [Limnochordia bacterium]